VALSGAYAPASITLRVIGHANLALRVIGARKRPLHD
jgi:hypothetical protein